MTDGSSTGVAKAGPPNAGHPSPAAERVVVLAPFGRDAIVIAETLGRAGIATTIARDLPQLVRDVRSEAGAALLTEESLPPTGVTELMAALAEQPSWSDIPVLLLLASDHGVVPDASRHLAALRSARNLIVLQRPIPAVSLVTAVQSAVQARRRQYEVRDLIIRERLAREEAENATRIKDEFLATVSHELRTPLSAILIWSQLLGAGRLTGEQLRQAADAVARGANAQSQLIEDLLDVSRMLTGKLRLDVHRRELAPIVLAAIEVVRAMADAKGVRLEAQLGDCAGLVLVDADRAQQIFWNLLSNAVKFTPSGGRVCVQIAREPRSLRVEVSDTGEGIDPEFLPRVFERFQQGDPSSTRRHGGLGLGLTIVQQLVELHGGTIEVRSGGKGRGTTFTVRLPVVAERSREPGAPAAQPQAATPLSGVRVLLAEDDRDTQQAICWALRQAGANVTAVDRAADALSVLASAEHEGRPDVLISDIAMPGQSGHALIEAVREREERSGERALPAIAISGYTRDEDRRRALEAGFQLHLAKPISPSTLEAAIRQVLEP